jgi:hypothetical protein
MKHGPTKQKPPNPQAGLLTTSFGLIQAAA